MDKHELNEVMEMLKSVESELENYIPSLTICNTDPVLQSAKTAMISAKKKVGQTADWLELWKKSKGLWEEEVPRINLQGER